jgi:hypothetical protein
MEEAAKQAFLWHVHDYLGEYARFADTKAAFAGTLAAALLGGLYSAKVFIPLFTSSHHQWSLSTWLALFAGALLCLSVLLTMATVYPRLKTTRGQGFIFWGNIAAHRDIERLRTSFHSQSIRTLNDHLISQTFIVSKHVCIPKYRNVSLCLILLALGAILAAAALLAKDVQLARPTIKANRTARSDSRTTDHTQAKRAAHCHDA